jgi:transposase
MLRRLVSRRRGLVKRRTQVKNEISGVIVKRLRAKHYHLVTLPRLLADDPPPDGRRPPKLHTER